MCRSVRVVGLGSCAAFPDPRSRNVSAVPGSPQVKDLLPPRPEGLQNLDRYHPSLTEGGSSQVEV